MERKAFPAVPNKKKEPRLETQLPMQEEPGNPVVHPEKNTQILDTVAVLARLAQMQKQIDDVVAQIKAGMEADAGLPAMRKVWESEESMQALDDLLRGVKGSNKAARVLVEVNGQKMQLLASDIETQKVTPAALSAYLAKMVDLAKAGEEEGKRALARLRQIMAQNAIHKKLQMRGPGETPQSFEDAPHAQYEFGPDNDPIKSAALRVEATDEVIVEELQFNVMPSLSRILEAMSELSDILDAGPDMLQGLA